MEKLEVEKGCNGSEETGQLNRNRSFKTKQLVRSQAIRESTSPPRTVSPSAPVDGETITDASNGDSDTRTHTVNEQATSDASSHISDDRGSDVVSFSEKTVDCVSGECNKKQHVEIQITSGAWDLEAQTEQRQRTKRWLGQKHHSDSSRDLLSNNPRVACVCGMCAACPHCRGRRRRHVCPTKQDSGIVCSDDCPDCSDSEQTGSNGDGLKKTGSLDVDDQPFYCRCPERKDKPKSISLSRTDSDDKTEPTGPELVNFIKETLNKNARDRMTLLKIEKELHALVNDTGRCIVRFPVMTSYGRMLVHRCAALFQLSHHLDQTNKNSVLVSKSGTSGGRIPCTSFNRWCTATFPPSPQRHQPDTTHAKCILKRGAAAGAGAGAGRAAARSKSLEQRERDYEQVRRRIFSTDNCNQDESQWPWLNSGPVKLLTPESGRNKLLKVQSLESSAGPQQSWRGRGAVSKSHSFGGYGGGGGEPPQTRLLSRQGDLASSSWRLSPSSSGYKTLSLRSTDSVTPSPTGGASPEPGGGGGSGGGGGALVWAVTDLSAVPPGALVIHPQTGRPLTNPDGSLYHFDPNNPPVLYDAGVHVPQEQKVDQSCDKRRGRLEKQHSFMDNDCECQPTEDCRNKCCCECRRHDACQQRNGTDKTTALVEQKTNSKPLSPCKSRYDQNPEAPSTNHSSPTEVTTNHRATYDPVNNQRAPLEAATNQRPAYDILPNQRQVFDTAANQRPVYEVPANTRQSFESTVSQRSFDAPSIQRPPFESQRSFDASTNQRSPSFEHTANQKPSYEVATNQRTPSDVTANHRAGVNKPTNQESQDMQQYVTQQNYAQVYRNDEMQSPAQIAAGGFPQHEVVTPGVMPTKLNPLPVPEHNMRPMSLTNMMYQNPVAQGYPYVSQCRVDQQMQPAVYQPMMQQPEEHKQLTPSPHNDTTFRIDPSYPYAPLEYGAQCGACAGACVDTTGLHQQQRNYNMAYGQLEMPPAVLPPTYPLSNVLLPQPHLQPYPYQEPVQWQGMPLAPAPAPAAPAAPAPAHKLYVHELYPLLQPGLYPHYNIVYPHPHPHPHPHVIPQPYPICQPFYPVLEKQPDALPRRNSISTNHRPSKHNSICGSSRNTPLQTPPEEKKTPYEESQKEKQCYGRESRQNTEIAVKIQQIKEQMAQLNTREREKGFRRQEEWKRRNSGNGILGSYPVNNHFNGRVMGRSMNDETQLTSAARAIVNSIRNMQQTKNTYNHDNRRGQEYNPQYQRNDKPDRDYHRTRSRQERDFEPKHPGSEEKTPGESTNIGQKVPDGRETQDGKGDGGQGGRVEGMRGRNVGMPFQYRPPYLLRQMSPGTWCRRSPGPVHPVLNQPRRPHPDSRNGRR